ncbi:concanavalin A-like lectin/glucanase domain-containing protein, partial [Lineolata rhizophorae]
TNDCTLFSINGSTIGNFTHYRFYDFRDVYADDAAADSSSDDAIPQSRTIRDNTWMDQWSRRDQLKEAWNDNIIDMEYNARNIYIENSTEDSGDYSTFLTLYTTRLADGSQQAGEFDYVEANVTYLSLRLLARVSGSSGAVAGFFTYHNDTSETDIEVLTRDPTSAVHYSNQPTADDEDNIIAGATFNNSMPPGQPWDDWQVHRLDWLPGQSVWYVNGVQTGATRINVPDVAQMVILNMWSNGGSFAGRMEVGGEAYLNVQWLEMVYNTTDVETPGSDGDPTVCFIEE